VLFRVRSYEKYGALSGRSVDDMIAGARVEVAPYKEDPMDFVLWKPSDDATPGWDSPWGRGRPGWHIECSAMADELLWKKPLGEDRLSDEAKKHPHVFDIHGGGLDLQFPHHEDEIAQSCCANGTDEMARYWLHNEMLQVEGKKMSKSLGNFFTVRDLLDQGVPGEVIRFVMLSTHYRKPMDWTEKKREEAEKTLRDWYRITADIEPSQISNNVIEKLCLDLDTYGAIDALRKLAKGKNATELLASARFLGLLPQNGGKWCTQLEYGESAGAVLDTAVKLWGNAVAEKNYELADTMRARFDESAIIIDKGLRQTDPLKFARSLTPEEKRTLSVTISEFLNEPRKSKEAVTKIMAKRAKSFVSEFS
jgi:cysteinyl-tRNA synthetase